MIDASKHPLLILLLLVVFSLFVFPGPAIVEAQSPAITEVHSDLQRMNYSLKEEILPAIVFHQEMVETFLPRLQDKFSADWNGISIINSQPNWIEPADWRGYWDLRTANFLFNGDPEQDTFWPLIDTPGLIEMITMDMQYLEGSNYAVSSQSVYTDTLISTHFDWFAALYSKEYSSLVEMAEKIVSVYVLQHNMAALLEQNGHVLAYEIIPDSSVSGGKVNFRELSLTGYPELIASLGAIADNDFAHRLVAATGEVEESEPIPGSSDPQYPSPPPQEAESNPDPQPVDTGPNLLVIILWPMTLVGASGLAFWIGRRK